jgi:two-component system phosphate regulon sensor histidine kinase PhoR
VTIKFNKTYRFAVKSATYIALFATALVAGLMQFFYTINWEFITIFALLLFVFSFATLQYRVEHFIYRRVKKIYDDISLLESSTFRNKSITTDMATLTRELEKYARDKKREIETLKIEEEYRREFVGNVSHELKTPLFTVQGYILTLLDGAMNDKTLRKKYLQRAEKGVERLIYIVQDLDMITKMEVGDLNLSYSEFNIVEVIQSVFDLKADKKSIMLMFDQKYIKPIMVYADRDKIQQVITNLVVNSIKYGSQDGTTEIGIEDLVNNKIIVRVKDNGEGIERRHIPRLFERFYRVDRSGARAEGGSGLGLAIVKHIIEGHDEKLYVESTYGKGSEFSFTLEKTK